jgi:hypothetical protein
MKLRTFSNAVLSSFYEKQSANVLAIFALALPSIIVLALLAARSHQNKVQDWLPADFPETRQLAEFRRNFSSDQFVVVSWDGCKIGGNPARPDAAPDDPRIEQLAQLLRGETKPYTDDRPNQGAAGAQKPNQPSASLIAPNELKLLKEELPKYISNVTTARRVLNQMTLGENAVDYSLAVKRLIGTLLGPDGNRSCIVVYLSDRSIGCFEKVLSRTKPVSRLQTVSPDGLLFKAMQAVGINPETAAVGGPPVDNVAIDQEGQRTLMRLAGLSALLGIALAWASLRSIKLTAMVFTCGIVSALGSLSIIAIMGDHTDAILFSMPPLIYVLAISGAIHLINYYRDAVLNDGPQQAVETAMRAGWKPAVLCNVTTSLGLLSLLASELTPIRKFGFYSATGVALMLSTLFLLLPAMLKVWPVAVGPRAPVNGSSRKNRQPSQPSFSTRFWTGAANGIVRHYGVVGMSCFLFIAGMSYGLTRTQSNIDLMKLFHPSSRILQDYHWLEANLGRLVPLEIVLRFDHRFVTNEAERKRAIDLNLPIRPTLSLLDRIDLVRNVQLAVSRNFGPGGKNVVGPPVSITTFIPPFPGESSSFAGEVKRRAVRTRLENSMAQLQQTGYLKIDPKTGDELWRISLRVAAFEGVDYGAFTTEIKQVVDPLIASATAQIKHIDRPVIATYTGVIPIVYKAQHSLLTSLVSSTWWSFLTITPLLMLVSRSFLGGIVAMLPNILPVIFIFGSMGWLGINIDIGSLMSASIALGVAVDDTIHFLTWFRRDLEQTGNRRSAIVSAYKHCAVPTLQASTINGLGLSVFAFSTFVPTQKFGLLMLAILFAGMVAELILLPALLASPLGEVFEKKVEIEEATILPFPEQQAA